MCEMIRMKMSDRIRINVGEMTWIIMRDDRDYQEKTEINTVRGQRLSERIGVNMSNRTGINMNET